MKQKNLWLLVGAPGSGKSTWVKQQAGKYISRDEIRFSMLKEGDRYFDHEKEVFAEFARRLKEALTEYDDVYADASHLAWGSRRKTLSAVLGTNSHITANAVVFNTSLPTCIERNSHRTGHANVPDDVITNMYNSMTSPLTDNYNYSQIIEVNEDGTITHLV